MRKRFSCVYEDVFWKKLIFEWVKRSSFLKMGTPTKHKTGRMNSQSRISLDGCISSSILSHCVSWNLLTWQLTWMSIFSGFVFRSLTWEWDIVSSDSRVLEVNSTAVFLTLHSDKFENLSTIAFCNFKYKLVFYGNIVMRLYII